MITTDTMRKWIPAAIIIMVVLAVASSLLLFKMTSKSDNTILSVEISGDLNGDSTTTTTTVSKAGAVMTYGIENKSYSLSQDDLIQIKAELRKILNTDCSPQYGEHFSTTFTVHLDGQTKTDSTGGCSNEIGSILQILSKYEL